MFNSSDKGILFSYSAFALAVIACVALSGCLSGEQSIIHNEVDAENASVEIIGNVPQSMISIARNSGVYKSPASKSYIACLIDKENNDEEIIKTIFTEINFKLKFSAADKKRWLVLCLKDEETEKILYQCMIGRIPSKSELAGNRVKIDEVVPDERTTAIAIMLAEKKALPEYGPFCLETSEIASAMASKNYKTFEKVLNNALSETDIKNIEELAKAVKASANILISNALDSNSKNALIKYQLKNISEILSAYVSIIKEYSNISTVRDIIAAQNIATNIVVCGTSVNDKTSDLDLNKLSEALTENKSVEPPEFTPPAGEYSQTIEVAIKSIENNTTIKYTLDGSEPSNIVGFNYEKPIILSENSTIKAVCIKDGLLLSSVKSASYKISIPLPASDVKFEPAGGTYDESVEVVLKSETLNAKIKYTLDGSVPSNENGYNYTGPFTIEKSSIIKALALCSGMLDSQITTASYVITRSVGQPAFNVKSGEYLETKEIILSCPTIDAIIKYTLDGSVPSESNGIIYGPSILINSNTFLKAIAMKNGWRNSAVASAEYIVKPPAIAPIIETFPGDYVESCEIKIKCGEPGASIVYTIDGSEPSEKNGFEYRDSVIISRDTVIKAAAYTKFKSLSAITTANYKIKKRVSDPVFSLSSGSYTGSQTLVLSCAESGASIKYTIDGSEPSNENGIVYAAPIFITSSLSIKAIALKNEMADSNIISSSYIINFPPSIPSDTISPNVNLISSVSALTNESVISVKAVFEENVEGFCIEDISAVNASAQNLVETNKSEYNFEVVPAKDGDVEISINKAVCKDRAGNFNNASNVIKFKSDRSAPTIKSLKLSNDNSRIDITLSESIYASPDASGALDKSKIGVSISGGKATLSSYAITHIAGSDSAMITLNISGTADGSEILKIKPETGTAVYDEAGNAMAASEEKSVNLNDKQGPAAEISYSSIPARAGELNITVTYSEAVKSGNIPEISINQKGAADISNQQMTPNGDRTVFTYKYNVIKDNGGDYIDGEALVSLTKVEDEAGNQSSDPANAAFEISTLIKISSVSTINDGDSNPFVLLTLSGDKFHSNESNVTDTSNWVLNSGTTGLTIGSINKNSDNEVKINFSGSASAGALEINAKIAALKSGLAVEAPVRFNIITDKSYFLYSDAGDSITIIGHNGFDGSASNPYAAAHPTTCREHIRIPEYIDGKPVKAIGNYSFLKCENLKSVTIPDGVSAIGSDAFQNCTALADIILPSSLKTIGNNVFRNCKINAINIPNGVTSIGNYSFGGCRSLTNLVIPDSVTSIGCGAFIACDRLDSITLSANLTTIESDIFQECSALVNIVIPEKVTTIKGYAFFDCINLTSVSIPESVTTIENNAFNGCEKLNGVVLPSKITIMSYGLFGRCKSLTSIVIPPDVTTIQNGVFSGCTNLSEINIPNKVEKIGDTAFSSCKSLTSLTLPSSITTIGSSAFINCDKLSSFVIPDNVKVISQSMFEGCTGLLSVHLPNGITKLETSAFRQCTSLAAITLPDSLTTMDYHVFNGCSALVEITIPNNVTSINRYSFKDCTNLKTVNLSNKLTAIEDETFYGATALTAIAIPNSVQTIGKSAFKNCAALESLTLSSSLTSIGELAFADCNKITTVNIPETVTTIGNGAFATCTSLESAYFYGNAPSTFGIVVFKDGSGTTGFKIYYKNTKTGWVPNWKGYTTEIF